MIGPVALTYLTNLGAKVTPCGSRVTCNPPPLDTDEDWLVFLPWHSADRETVSKLIQFLYNCGFENETSQNYQDAVSGVNGEGFLSLRNRNVEPEVNLIVTSNETFAHRHHLATELCRRLNLMIKDQRILVFQTLLYGNVAWTR